MRDCEGDVLRNDQVLPGFTLSPTPGQRWQRWQRAPVHSLSEADASSAETGSTSLSRTSFTLQKSCLAKPVGFFREWEGLHTTLGIPPWESHPGRVPSKPDPPTRRAAGCPGAAASGSGLSRASLLTEDTHQHLRLRITTSKLPAKQ